MSELVQSIIFAIFGVAIVIGSLLTGASWEVMGLGVLVTVIAMGCIIYNSNHSNKI